MTEGAPQERVAVALDAATRVLPVLNRHKYVLDLAVPSLTAARQWLTGEPMPARRLYGHIHPLMERMSEDELTGRELSAATAVVYALFYVTWHARQIEGPIGPALPNDICEVSEDTLTECLKCANSATELSQYPTFPLRGEVG